MERGTRAIVLPSVIGRLGVVCLAVLAAGCKGGEVWFGDLRGPAAISDEDGRMLVRYAREALVSGDRPAIALPRRLRSDGQARVVFLSASRGRRPARVIVAGRRGIVSAVEAAAAGMARGLGTEGPVLWVKLDVVDEVRSVSDFRGDVPEAFGRGVTGLALGGTSGPAVLPDELSATSPAAAEVPLPLAIAGAFRNDPVRQRRAALFAEWLRSPGWVFSAKAWFTDGRETLALYRGHRMFDSPSADDALRAARLGGNYLARSVGSGGRFVYAYSPASDEESPGYNILRHAGTTYSLLEIYSVTRDPAHLAAARRALRYLLGAIRTSPTDKQAAWVVQNDTVSLGGNGLAVVALAKHAEITGDRTHLPMMRMLARWMVSVQGQDGRFTVHKQNVSDREPSPFRSAYYPGEAILGLLRLYRLDPQAAWLDTAERAAKYLITVRDGRTSDEQLPHDHWLLYGLNELHRLRPRPVYLRRALRLARVILAAQNRRPERPDWMGSFYSPPRVTPTATRAEGLGAAWLLARDFGHEKEAAAILTGIRLAIAMQLGMQFRPESVLYHDDPARAIGGFRRSFESPEIRIDYVQHNISALLAYRRILQREAKQSSSEGE